jgi:hypothetical protein
MSASVATRVRQFIQTLKPGDHVTNRMVAEAIGYVPARNGKRSCIDRGPISGPMFSIRQLGAIKVIRKDQMAYVFEVVDPKLLDDIPITPSRGMQGSNAGHGEGSRRPNRAEKDLKPEPPVPVPEPEIELDSGNGGYVRLKISYARVLARVSLDALLAEVKRRVHGQGDSTSTIRSPEV